MGCLLTMRLFDIEASPADCGHVYLVDVTYVEAVVP